MPDGKLSDLRAELGRIQEELNGLPEDAHQPRWELRARQRDLRNEATALASGKGRTAQQLQAELSRLVKRRDRRLERGVNPATVGGGGAGGGGIDGYELAELNRQIRTGQGIDELDQRIASLRAQLARTEQEPDAGADG